MTSEGTARGRFQRAIHARNLLNAETAAREMGGLSLADALALCELLAAADPNRCRLRRSLRPAGHGACSQCGRVLTGTWNRVG